MPPRKLAVGDLVKITGQSLLNDGKIGPVTYINGEYVWVRVHDKNGLPYTVECYRCEVARIETKGVPRK